MNSNLISQLQNCLAQLSELELTETELQTCKDLVLRMLAQIAVQGANQAWERNGWTQNDMEKMLRTKMRLYSINCFKCKVDRGLL